ncbi:sulfite exporter TauE/SafE family protein [Couchioplanes caeruleus]|uniref:sulfite exporter TauE/SafE family protein n=1 Tax=Couchioplanes caeruleus TaxID=56438 RepID=UPI0020BFA09E|nr:sulfite exporter TauE/SafE family protein [Couchioplanes caeruleus]UQU67488.1 sulfite exporter TauE/SafE family protein [Couchioplanes caeruleus]
MNLYAILLTGLVAGGVSCAAVQGGLLTAIVLRSRSSAPTTSSPAQAGHVTTRLADDLTPVAGFLAGKLISHTLLGALLGALGTTMQLSVTVRMMMQIAAGVLIIVLALAQLGVPGFRDVVIEPPAGWGRLVRGRTRAAGAAGPTVLGLLSVLIPCGVTLSVQALALTSGSWVRGAAIMAVFVMGTAPLFTVLGYLARKAAGAWRAKLATVTGLVVLAMGLYTFNGGLELTGSPLAASRIAEAIGVGPDPVTVSAAPDDAPPLSITADGIQQVIVTAVTGAYHPANIEISAGVPTRLIVRSDDAGGCVRAFVIPSRDYQQILPVNGDTVIELGALQPGRLTYSCGMGMYTGRLTVKEPA